MTIKELKEKRDRLSRIQRKEYNRLGNTQRCQELFDEIEKIDEQIERLKEEERYDGDIVKRYI